jgi:hypothetical protein
MDPDPGGLKTFGKNCDYCSGLVFGEYKHTQRATLSFTRKLLSLCSGDDLSPECRVQFLLGLEVEVGEGPVQHLAHTLARLQHVV